MEVALDPFVYAFTVESPRQCSQPPIGCFGTSRRFTAPLTPISYTSPTASLRGAGFTGGAGGAIVTNAFPGNWIDN